MVGRVEDLDLDSVDRVGDLIAQMGRGGGFMGPHLARGLDILEEMEKERCLKFLSFPACIVSTGCRGVIKTLVEKRLVDVIVTTCGTLDHDLARSWGFYCSGSFDADDVELHKKGVHRLGNVFIPMENYGPALERGLWPIFERIYGEKRRWGGRELIERVGDEVDDRGSILHWATKNRVPVYVPGIFDGAFGSQLWSFWQDHRDFAIDLLKDEQELADLVFDNEKSGALIVGGGISKHHTIWWNQFKDGLDYGVYITTGQEWDGSLSGARLREGISWGKVNELGKEVTIQGEATLLLPFLVKGLMERLV
jgi:deoxyhypusine synthase